ncbi:DUF1931 domain-containing protein [Candidatus Woesearchaeota archaeon]|nr:DUF1931 domain-containing protein [Candidatus Woesearchaeota archaeon]
MGLVVKTNISAAVKEISRQKGYSINNIADDFLPAINAKVKKVVEEAIERARANNRRTLMGRDL